MDPIRDLSRVLERGIAGINEVARFGSDILLAALLARLGWTIGHDTAEPGADAVGAEGEPGEELSPAELIARGLLAGKGRYTRLEVAERAGISPDQARRLWRALGFAEVGDDQEIFTGADVDALRAANALLTAGLVDDDTMVDLARPLGNLMSRLAAAQTNFISEVLGARIADGFTAEDPELPSRLASHALVVTQELLPTLELTTTYAWRRHLAAEIRRALIPEAAELEGGVESRPAAVGFIDMTGYTRLSRSIGLTGLADLLDHFETAVLDTVVAHGGRVIKNLGDEILFVADDPVAAAEAVLQLIDLSAAEESLPPFHAGLAFGPVLYRAGDVYGPVVNTAARLSGLARKGTVRVDQGMATELADAEQFTLAARAPRHVRGYLQLPSYRLRRSKQQ